MAYVYAPLTTKVFPTIQQTISAITKADSSDPAARDIRDFASILNRCTVANPRLAGHILTRKTAVSSYKWTISAKDSKDAEAAARVQSRLSGVIRHILKSHTDTPLFGQMAIELEWSVGLYGNGPRVLRRLRPYEVMKNGEILTVVNEDGSKGQSFAAGMLDGSQWIGEVDGQEDTGGLLRSIAFHCILQHETLVEWSKLNRRMKGVVAGTVDAQKMAQARDLLNLTDSQVNAQIEALDTILKEAGENNFIKTFSAIEVQLKSLVEGTAGRSYADFLSDLRNDIAVAILGQANTTQLPNSGGSRAALQVLDYIRADIAWDDMERVTNTVNTLVLWDYRTNDSSSATETPWEFSFVNDEVKDTEANARMFETVSRIGNVAVSKSEFYEKLNLSLPAPDAETITLGSTTQSPL